jgi:hypothetical protein
VSRECHTGERIDLFSSSGKKAPSKSEKGKDGVDIRRKVCQSVSNNVKALSWWLFVC